MRFLICGLGSIGYRHLKILKSFPEIEVWALRSKNSKLELQIKPDREIYNFDEIINLKQFDGILITNPSSMHISTALNFAHSGVPLFIEKPLGSSLKGVYDLKTVCLDEKTSVLVGNNLIYHRALISISKILENREIGDVICVRSQFGTYMPDWHPWEDYRESYASKSSLGGGVVLTSIHEMNYITRLFGEVDEIKAFELGGSVLGIEAEEGVEILLKHKNGITSNIHLNFFQIPYRRYCELIGEKGTLFWDFSKPKVELWLKDKIVERQLGKSSKELLDESYRSQMKHFIDVCKGDVEPIVPIENGITDLENSLEVLKQIGRI